MVDTLLEGRFILGVGPGGLISDAEMMQTMDEEVMAYRLCTEKRVGSKKFSTGFSGF